MTDMIERVARTLWESLYGDRMPWISTWGGAAADIRTLYRNAARAAIADMREPTDETAERAGRAALCGWNNVADDNATMAAEWERMGPATREAWMRAMRRGLSAALSEGDKP